MNFNEYFEYKNGELFWKITSSNRAIKNKKAGYKRKDNYCFLRFNKKTYGIHQVVFAMHHGYIPKEIDHIDANPSNNFIENLREATRSQNALNQPLTIKNSSGIKGVSWHKSAKKWVVQLTVNGKAKYFGTYFDIEVAKFIAETMRHKYHGNYANHG
jgi:hypothetical protein